MDENSSRTGAVEFDTVLRSLDSGSVARRLFAAAEESYLWADARYENVKFDAMCDDTTHTADCTIRMVTIRRRSDGPNGDDVYSRMFFTLNKSERLAVAYAHSEAHGLW